MSEVLANVKVKEEPPDWDYYSNFESAAMALGEEMERYNYFDPIPIKQEVKQEEVKSEIQDCRQSTLSSNFKQSKRQMNTTWFTKCEVCNKKFCDSNSFLKHIDAQRDSYCMKSLFPWNSNRRPNRYHPNNMFMCKTCKRRFPDDAGIRRHYATQGGVCRKHLQCRICFVSLETKAQVLKHINTEHKTHKCDCCSAVFVRERYLNFHIINCHRNNRIIPLVDISESSENSQDDYKNSDANKTNVKAENMADVKPEITPLDCRTNIKSENVSNADFEMKVLNPEPLKLQQRVPTSTENIEIEASIKQLEKIVHACEHVSYGENFSKKSNNKTLSHYYRNRQKAVRNFKRYQQASNNSHYYRNRQKAVRNFKRYQQALNKKYQQTHQKFNVKTPMANANIIHRETNQYEFANTVPINMNRSSPMTESNWGVNDEAFTTFPLINPMPFLMEQQCRVQEYYNLGGGPDVNNT